MINKNMTQVELAEIHNQLKALREAEEKKAVDLASSVGMSVQQLSNIEQGRNTPSIESVTRYLKGLGYKLFFKKDDEL